MNFAQFAQYHHEALGEDEVRYNQILSVLNRGLSDEHFDVRFWSLGSPGVCAVQKAGGSIVLGNITEQEAGILAFDVRYDDIPSAIGPDNTAKLFVDAAMAYGHRFPIVLPETIHLLNKKPDEAQVPGSAHQPTTEQINLVHVWLNAFVREAVPHEHPPSLEEADQRVKNNRIMMWSVDGRMVAMSCVGRMLAEGVAIAAVYTPPWERCHGYGGAVTAAMVNQILARGYRYAYLYTDDHNPASNRCYANIGFQPYCRSLHYRKVEPPISRPDTKPQIPSDQ